MRRGTITPANYEVVRTPMGSGAATPRTTNWASRDDEDEPMPEVPNILNKVTNTFKHEARVDNEFHYNDNRTVNDNRSVHVGQVGIHPDHHAHQ